MSSEQQLPVTPVRAAGLDALRGFAILTMILSGRVPFGPLPAWMYHIQVPPPLHKFNPNLPGISWVDLVFPFFLFSMGAAFPLALGPKIEKGVSKFSLITGIVARGLLLMFFALVIQHIRPTSFTPSPGLNENLVALCCFLFVFLAFWRTPSGISKNISYALKGIGYGGLIIFLAFAHYPSEQMPGFSFRRYDIIILVLSNVAIAGSLIWMFTRTNIMLRLGIMALLFAVRLSSPTEDYWMHTAAVNYPGWMLFQLNFLKYLFIVIPGTIAGDILRQKFSEPVAGAKEMPRCFYCTIAAGMFLLNLLLLFGLYNRLILFTLITSLIICGYIWYLFTQGDSVFDQKYFLLFKWGVFWLLLGLLLEPFEGGIKKDHSTMSYYFVTSGLAIFMIIGFTIIIEILNGMKFISVLVTNGQNPMLAYAGGTNLLNPLADITGFGILLSSILPGAWPGVLKGIILTGTLALIVHIFTRKKIFWRT